MSARPRFEEILDRCIDDIAAGRRTVEQCLEAWPEHREALASVLDAASALHELPRVPERAPDPARRARLMSQIRALPQEPLIESVPTTDMGRRRFLRAPSLPSFGGGRLGSLGRAGAIAVPAAAAAVLAIMLVLGGGTSSAHAATLTVFDGEVQLASGDAWSSLTDGDEIREGDRLRTTSGGRALVTFADGSTVALDPDTELTVSELEIDDTRRITLVQASGRLWHDVAASPDGDGYTIETPDATVVATGTLFETLVRKGETAVTTEEGSVEVLAGQLRASVRAGETTVAQARRLLTAVRQRQASPEQVLQLSIDAPFTASLIDPFERATGARPDGLVYQQVPNAITTNPGSGDQRIAVASPHEGTYELVLRRFEAGAGVVVLRIGDQTHEIPLDTIESAVRVRLRLASQDGRLVVTPEVVERVRQETIGDVVEHVVVTDRARENAQSVAEQRAALLAAQPPSQPDSGASPEPTRPATTPSDAATATPTAEPGGSTDATPEATAVAAATPTVDATPAAASPAGTLTLDQAADRCASGIRYGSTTVEECLKRWPELGDALVTRVRERLRALRATDVALEEAVRICRFELAWSDYTPTDCYERWPRFADRMGELLESATSVDATPTSTPTPTPTPTRTDGTDAGATDGSSSGSLDSAAGYRDAAGSG